MLWLFLIAMLVGLGVVYGSLWKKITSSKPEKYPTLQNRQNLDATKKTLVCLGDSITHGIVSYDWVTDLTGIFPDLQILNAGINSDLTFTILNRIDDVIDCRPDFIIILAGTNDVNAMMSSTNLKSYKQMGRISKETIPDFESFKNNYHQIVALLKQKTTAQIALVSLPVMSEDLTHEANMKADNYSAYVKQLTQEEQLGYLPFREIEKEYLLVNPRQLKHKFEETTKLFTFSLINHFILGKDWDYTSAKHGNQLSPDNLHLNSLSGGMLLDLAKAFITSIRSYKQGF